MCLVGSGDGHLRARGVGERSAQAGVGSQKAARDEYSYVNTCALFFVKRGFPYVSVLEGVSASLTWSLNGQERDTFPRHFPERPVSPFNASS